MTNSSNCPNDSLLIDLEDSQSATGSHSPTLMQNFGSVVRDANLRISDLEAKVSHFLDDIRSERSARGTMESAAQTKQAIDSAKGVQRKVAICLAGNPSCTPAMRLQYEKLSSMLASVVVKYNVLSTQIERAIATNASVNTNNSDQGGADLSPSKQRLTPQSTTTSSPFADNAPGFGELPSSDTLQGLRQVKSNFEATQQIFDELGCLIRQQAPHLDQLEHGASGSRQYTKQAAEELSKTYRRHQQRMRRNWTIFFLILASVFLIWYTQGRPTIYPRQHALPASSDAVIKPAPAPPAESQSTPTIDQPGKDKNLRNRRTT